MNIPVNGNDPASELVAGAALPSGCDPGRDSSRDRGFPVASAALPQDHRGLHGPDGLYGPRGWTVRTGVWRLLSPWAEEPDRLTGHAARGGSAGTGRTGARSGRPAGGQGAPAGAPGCEPVSSPVTGPAGDYVPFRGLDHVTARELLSVLPGAALGDRQNRAPCLGALLRACAGAQGRIRLSGYGIGPQRHDERVSVEALWVADADLLDRAAAAAAAGHGGQCWYESLWRTVARRYQLGSQTGERPDDRLAGWSAARPGAVCVPDEILVMRPPWAGGAAGWWMWWD